MRSVIVGFMHLVVAVSLIACFRYVEEMRPMTEADCGPVPPSKAFIGIAADSRAVGTIAGQVLDADSESGIPTGLAEAVLVDCNSICVGMDPFAWI